MAHLSCLSSTSVLFPRTEIMRLLRLPCWNAFASYRRKSSSPLTATKNNLQEKNIQQSHLVPLTAASSWYSSHGFFSCVLRWWRKCAFCLGLYLAVSFLMNNLNANAPICEPPWDKLRLMFLILYQIPKLSSPPTAEPSTYGPRRA
jgi:hypothetical protein